MRTNHSSSLARLFNGDEVGDLAPLPHAYGCNPLNRLPAERNEATWQQALASGSARLVLFDGDRVAETGLSEKGKKSFFFTPVEAERAGVQLSEAVMLGTWKGVAYGAAAFSNEAASCTLLRTLTLSGRLDDALCSLLAQGRSLIHWHTRARFCGLCGNPTRPMDTGTKRVCETCRAESFPRVDPVVIMLVVDIERTRILLANHAQRASKIYSTLAGFIEPGETFEDAVRRETFEETGIRVGRVRYVASQPWPFPANLMIGCVGEAVSSTLTIDPHEILDARWFSLAEIEQMNRDTHPEGLCLPSPLSISRSLIGLTLAGGELSTNGVLS